MQWLPHPFKVVSKKIHKHLEHFRSLVSEQLRKCWYTYRYKFTINKTKRTKQTNKKLLSIPLSHDCCTCWDKQTVKWSSCCCCCCCMLSET